MMKKTLPGFVLSYIFVLSIPLLIGSIVYVNAVRIAEEDSILYNNAMLKQVQEFMDSRLREINNLSYQILANSKINRLIKINKPMDINEKYSAIQLTGDLLAYRNISSVIDDFYICFFRSGTVMTSSTIYGRELFYSSMYNERNISFEQWYGELAEKNYYQKYLPAKTGMPLTKSLDAIECRQSIPINSSVGPDAVLVILMDKKKINDMLNNMKSVNGGNVYAIDEDGNIIASTRGELPQYPLYHELEGSEGFKYMKAEGVDSIITYKSSSVVNWKYVSVIPIDIFMEKVNYIKTLTVKLFSICLGLGILAAFVLAYRNYSPIRRLVGMISRKLNSFPRVLLSDADYIVESVGNILSQNELLVQHGERIMRENHEIVKVLNEQKAVVVNNLFCRLLKSTKDDYSQILKSLNSHGIVFKGAAFCTVIFQWDNYLAHKNTVMPVHVILSKLKDRLESDKDMGYCMNLADSDDGSIIAIFNFCACTSVSSIISVIRETAADLANYLESELNIEIFAGIGKLHDGADALQLSYREAQKALDYRMLKECKIVSYSDIVEKNDYYYYPLEIELKIINRIKSGDCEKAIELLDFIFRENLHNRMLPLELARCLIFDMISTIAKVMHEMDVNYKEATEYNPVKDLMHFKNVNELYEKIKSFCKDTCNYINANKKSHNDALKLGILEYVNNNYMDGRMSVAFIAGKYNITATYLSHFFKEQTGQNLLDYINRLRVNQAKLLLCNKALKIIDIAGLVGYSNDIVLMRTFKKYEGITPGKYRIEHCIV